MGNTLYILNHKVDLCTSSTPGPWCSILSVALICVTPVLMSIMVPMCHILGGAVLLSCLSNQFTRKYELWLQETTFFYFIIKI